MQIVINDNNEILAYATVGNLVNGINANIEIPSDFAPSKYMIVADGEAYSIQPNPEYVPSEEVTEDGEDLKSEIENLKSEIEILTNTYSAYFDGLKLIVDESNPMAVKMPMNVKANLFYSYNNKKYVCVQSGVLTADKWEEMMVEW